MVALPSNSYLLEKAVAGERLTPEEGLQLLESRDLVSLGRAADEVTRRLHPENYRTYNIDRNLARQTFREEFCNGESTRP